MPKPTEIRKQKDALRNKVWSLLEKKGAGRFPGVRGRIPNFVGAERAAERLEELDVWKKAKRIKANPDSPQAPARKRALAAGKIVYMAVPRLRERACFIELDPERIGDVRRAASIKGAFELGRPVTLDQMKTIDLVLCGSVAVTREGLRLGKGGGYSDLELALVLEAGRISPRASILTTVHPLQIVSAIPVAVHDFPLDWIVTPEEVVRCRPEHPRPRGIYWELLEEEKVASIPILGELQKKALSGAARRK